MTDFILKGDEKNDLVLNNDLRKSNVFDAGIICIVRLVSIDDHHQL